MENAQNIASGLSIHMNGRVYSPESGRFLSPDPLVQAPTYSQSFNRYSYVWNNPLNNIDPSGYAASRKRHRDDKECSENPWCTIVKPRRKRKSEQSPVAWTYGGPTIPDIVVTYDYKLDPNWIFPEGGSNDLNDYDRVQTNGIMGNRKEFTALVNKFKTPGYYNPSKTIVHDLGESIKQKFFAKQFGDAMARGFAEALATVDHAMNIIAHSQGTLTVKNAQLYYGGLPSGSKFYFKSPAISRSTAARIAQHNGGTYIYDQPWGDGANLWGPSLNPVKWFSGVGDLLCGFCTHINNGLEEGTP